jgi:hypothetical protein
MFNKLEARVLSEYKRSRAAPSTFCTLIKHYFSFIKHYINYGNDLSKKSDTAKKISLENLSKKMMPWPEIMDMIILLLINLHIIDAS